MMGAFMLFIGFVSGADQAMCGSSPMEPGDTCQVLEEGGAERTYEEQKQRNSTQNLWMFGLGGVMIVGGVVWFGSTVATVRKASRARKQAALHHAAQRAPGQQQYQ